MRAPIRSLAEAPILYPRVIAVAALLVLAADEAGYNPTGWYPVALLVLGLVVATVLSLGLPRPSRLVRVALILFAGFTAWTYASILWAADQGAALTGANRTTLYLLVFMLFAAWPGEARDGRVLGGLLGLGLALLGLIELIRLDRSPDPVSFFIEGRLVEPAGYVNANVALWTTGLIAALALGAGRDVPVALRAVAFGGAGVLASLALLGQSRGWLFALPAALVALTLVAPRRLRTLAAILAVIGVTAIVSGRLLAVHDEFASARIDELVSGALAATLTAAVTLSILAVAATLVDRRVAPRPELRARIGRLGLAVGAGAALAVLVAAFALSNAPTRLSDAWDEFKQGGQPSAGSSRFGSVGTYRYDFWRVAWELFEENVVAGIGADNFQDEYLRRSRGFEQPRFAHSLELGVLSQTGLIGAAMLFGALGCALTAAMLRRREGGPAFAWVSAGGLAVFVYWFLHASVDWLWEFPALTGGALAMLGLACAVSPQADVPHRRSRAPASLVAVGGLLLVPVLAAPWISEIETQRALDGWRGDAEAAFSSLDRAEALNPFSTRPLLVRGAIELERDRLPSAEAAFRQVLEKEPDNAYGLLELGAIAGERGRVREATQLLERARALRPRDEITADVLAALRRGERVRVSAVNARIVERARARVQRQP